MNLYSDDPSDKDVLPARPFLKRHLALAKDQNECELRSVLSNTNTALIMSKRDCSGRSARTSEETDRRAGE